VNLYALNNLYFLILSLSVSFVQIDVIYIVSFIFTGKVGVIYRP
jgi:hypothetical protein